MRILILNLLLVSACDSQLSVLGKESNIPRIDSLDKAAAEPGQIVSFAGSELSSELSLKIAEQPISFALSSSTLGSFTLPSNSPTGVVNIAFYFKGAKLLEMPIINSGTVSNLPLTTADATQMCNDTLFSKPDGTIIRGLRNCSIPTCTRDGQTACVANDDFPAVDKANKLIPENIRKDRSIGGVDGIYPSADAPLASNSVIDLNLSNFQARLASADSFQWFDREGTLHTRSGDTNLNSSSLSTGITLFGIAGSAPVYSSCSSDGEISCITTSRYKAADTQAIDSWDLRRGKTIGGINGNLQFFKNASNIDLFNRTTSPGSSSATDFYDSIDDWNAGGALPYTRPVGVLPISSYTNWSRDPVSDTGAGGGVANDSLCNGTENCVYFDKITRYYISPLQTSSNWETAISTCENLVYGGYSDWRLPHYRELFQIQINGFTEVSTPLGSNRLTAIYLWSSTTVSGNHSNAYLTASFAMFASAADKASESYPFHCLRENLPN